ncbi:MAG: hypothetical protein ACC645_11940 [Pirellulales bacterium]
MTAATRPCHEEVPHGHAKRCRLPLAHSVRGALVTLVNFLYRPQTVDLAVGESVKRVVNLFDNTEATFPLTLDSLDPVLLAIEWSQP